MYKKDVSYNWNYGDKLCATLSINFHNSMVKVDNYVTNELLLPMGDVSYVSLGTLENLINSRIPSEDNEHIQEFMSENNIKEYDIFEILNYTEGRLPSDKFSIVRKA